jgi:hypothetical protein
MKHFLNDIEISPRNREEIGIVSDFTDNPDILALTTESIVIPREAFQIVLDHIQTMGLFEGIPYRVEMDGGITLQYYADLTEGLTMRDHECEIKLKRRNGKDRFFEQADGTSFELMLAKGVQFNTFDVPYYIIKDNQVETAITLLLAIYIMTEQTLDAGKQLVESISEVIQATTPSVGTAVVVDTGDIIVAVLKSVARLIYFALLLTALLNLAVQMFTLLFPPQRRMKGIKFKELMEKACSFLGFQFQSSIFDSETGWTLLPVPLIKNRKSIFDFLPDEFNAPFNKGVPSSSDTTPTLGTFINGIETMFNAKTRVVNGVVRFERRDWWMNQTTNQIIPSLVLQSDRSDEYTFNTDEIWKRYYIHYQLDMTDLHSVDSPTFDGHDAEFSTEPTNVINADLVSIKGLNDVQIPFSLGARKNKLNWLELIAEQFMKIVDALTGLFGSGTNYATQIGERRNSLMISQQFYSVTKVLYTTNGRQNPDYMNQISATALWSRFHYINQIQLNDFVLKTNARIRLTSSDFVSLLDNNFAEIDGVICEILRVEWMDESKVASITYKIPSNYANGKVSTLTINS